MPRSLAFAVSVLRAPRLLLALLTVAAFANSVPNGFVWLDHWQAEGGGLIARSWADLWQAWREPLGAMPGWEGSAPYARPVVILVLSVVHTIAGPHPVAYHLTAGLLHLVNVQLVYDLLCALAAGSQVALPAAALFAVHPLQTAAVSWISGIADPLFTLFVLVAFRCQLVAARRHTVTLRLCAALCFLIALGSKETAAVLPFLLLATYLLLPGTLAWASGFGNRVRAVAGALAPFFVMLAGIALYRAAVLRSAALGSGFAAIPLRVRLLTVPRLILSYVTLPVRFGSLTICDDYDLSRKCDAATLLGVVVLVLLLVGVFQARRRAPFVALGAIWMLLGLVPILNIVPILHYRADRFFYFPFIGWSLAVGALLQAGESAVVQRRIFSAVQLSRVTTLVTAITVVGLAVLTIRRNALFVNDVTLFEATVQVSPRCREAHTALADAYLRADRNAEAAAEYERARNTSPDHASYAVMPKILINLGMAQLRRGEYASAATAFREAHELQPDLLHPLFGLGAANLGLGRAGEAAVWLEQAYAHDARDPDVVFNLALADDRLGRAAEALALYQRYLEIAPRGRARPLAQARIQALSTRAPQ